MKNLYLLITLLFIGAVNGQNKLIENKNYKNLKVILKNGTELKLNNASIQKDSLRFSYQHQKNQMSVPIDKISYAYLKTGSKAGTGAFIGGGIMLLASLSAIEEVNSDPNLELREGHEETLILVVGAGVALGALIGSAFPKWKGMHIERNEVSIKWSPTLIQQQQKTFVGTGVHIQF